MNSISITSDNPVVSVIMITYKHEPFIKEAIEGVLMQEVDFPVELIIADDCSPDKTSVIVQHYIDSHSKGHWIKYTRHEPNIGMMPNFIWAMKQAKGKYIALCEGDDYWTDPYKLKKQTDILKAERRYRLSFHSVAVLKNKELKKDSRDLRGDKELSLSEIQNKNLIHTVSIVFQRFNFNELPKWFEDAMPGDHPLQMFILKNGGTAYFIDQCMAVYRKHEQGVWSVDDGKKHTVKRCITKINMYNEFKYGTIEEKLQPLYLLADHCAEKGFREISLISYWWLLVNNIPFSKVSVKSAFYLLFPFLVKLKSNNRH